MLLFLSFKTVYRGSLFIQKINILLSMKTFVLFGSTGDLATRYVLPALGNLIKK
jgi:hypothetical protein